MAYVIPELCAHCGEPGTGWWVGRYADHHGPHGKRCHPCYLKYTRDRQNAANQRKAAARPLRPLAVKAPTKPTWVPDPRACVRCGSTFTPTQNVQMYCGNRCGRLEHAEAARRQRREIKRQSSTTTAIKCKVCSEWIVDRNRRVFCSDRCRVTDISARLMGLYSAALKVRNIPSAMHWHRRLCTYLAMRDGDGCGICGMVVHIDQPSGGRHDNGPSIDHIVPRSKGGSDDLANLRLTHWGCNRKRGNRGDVEQLRLVG